MNALKLSQQCQVIGALVEGNSIRGVGAHDRHSSRYHHALMVRTGDACDKFMDETMHGLTCERLQFHEIWLTA
jgi:hypothetical protein